MTKPDIFTYLDYRAFLADAYQEMRSRHRRLSYREFARRAGYTTPNFLQQVIKGKRGLNQDALHGTVAVLGLNKQETAFLHDLVEFDQARTHETKNASFQRIVRHRKFRQVATLAKEQYEYYSHWYHPVVRELLVHERFDGTPEWIARRIHPRISVEHVQRSIALLERLGLVKHDGNTWVQTDRAVSTPDRVKSLVVNNYQKAVGGLALDAIDAFGMDQRQMLSLTMGVDRETARRIHERLVAFWRELIGIAGESGTVEDVLHVNLQLFPFMKEDADETA